MLLAVDCGNTNVVCAVFEGETLRASWRIHTDSRRTADEYAVWLSQLMALQGMTRDLVDGAIIATVVPEALFNLKTLVRRYFAREPLVVGEADVELGIAAAIDRPEEAGADRLVNALAARRRYGAPLIVVDFGTATTFDVVDAEGNYAGGAIAPGINLSLEALHLAAAKLPRVAVARPERVIGKDTVPAMKSGIFWGYVGLVDGLVTRIREEFGTPMSVIATGGLAPLFHGACKTLEHLDLDLTLHGLAAIYRANRQRVTPGP